MGESMTRTETVYVVTELTADDPTDPDSMGAWTFVAFDHDVDVVDDVPYRVMDLLECNYLRNSHRPRDDALPADGERAEWGDVEFTPDGEIVSFTPSLPMAGDA